MDLPGDLRSIAVRPLPAHRSRAFVLLWIASIVVPLLGVATAGIASWRAVEQEASARLERTVELLRQNVLRAFGAQEAILAAVARTVTGREPESLRADFAVHALLADLTQSGAPVISGVLITDGASRIAAASWEFPARPADLSDRDYVRILRTGEEARAVGEPVASRPMGWSIIPVARRAPRMPDSEDAPAIVVSSFSPDAFSEFYASIAETPGDVVALLREDGALLARYPPTDPIAGHPDRAALAGLIGTLLAGHGAPRWVEAPPDGARRLFVGRRVGDWPVVVAYGLHRSALVATWWQRMVAPAAGAVAAMALLMALTAVAQRSARLQREQAERRAEAEAQLARAGRAAALGLLAAGLAHDVKNLVQSVRSGARIMQRRADDPAEVKHCAELLAEAAERGGKLVDAMLGFARGGNAPDAPMLPLEIGPVLEGLVALLSRTLGSGWRVRSLVPPGLPLARGARAGFEAAVVNLAANARDAMPDGGTVTIAAWTEELEEPADEAGLRPGHYIVVSVRDTGEGMDAATLARLGDPFFTTKPAGLGTGLGLATVRGYCTRAGGALRMDSAPGRGTTAAMWLPVA